MQTLLTFIAGALAVGLGDPVKPDDFDRCEKGRGVAALEACDRIISAGERNGKYAGWYIKMRGMVHFRNNQYERAIKDFDILVRHVSHDAHLFMIRGDAYHLNGQFDQAISDYSAVIRLDPQNIRAYYNRAITHRKQQKYQLAIHDFDGIIELKPGDARAYQNRGHIFLRLGEAENALPDFKRAVTLAPQDFDVHHSLGEGYYYAGEFDTARDTWQKSCKLLSPEVTKTWQTRLSKAGHYTQAVDGVCDGRMIEAFTSCAKAKCRF
ncbi:MAG: tetratricopeptide repeat protein [Aestuariivirgaceae bacterium]